MFQATTDNGRTLIAPSLGALARKIARRYFTYADIPDIVRTLQWHGSVSNGMTVIALVK